MSGWRLRGSTSPASTPGWRASSRPCCSATSWRRRAAAARAARPCLARALLAGERLPAPRLEALLAEVTRPAAPTRPAGAPPPAETWSPAGPPAPIPPAGAWRPDARVGGHVLEERLGAGGMGVVWRARHAATGVPYALKTLAGGADAELLLRLRREGEAMARIGDHPHVARVHTCGQAAGRVYLVTELLTGGDLEARLAGGSLAPAEAARLVADLARGLGRAHQAGVLHRDLKPANVLFDADGTPKLVDFGLARLAGADSLTESGTVMGTPAYMAPEQVDPARGEPGPPTDVYGLGAILYACLAGRPAFAHRKVVALLQAVLHEEPPRLRQLRADVPAALERVCRRALAKDPRERYPSAEALGEALDAAVGPAAKGAGRRWALSAALAAAAIAELPARAELPTDYALAAALVIARADLDLASRLRTVTEEALETPELAPVAPPNTAAALRAVADAYRALLVAEAAR